jgi:hypothetical protein
MSLLPGIVFPDIELAVTTYLRDALAERDEAYCANVHVSIIASNPRADRMVIVRRDGGRRLDAFRELARVGVQVWATDFGECVELANMVRALIQAMPDGDPVISATERSAPSPVDDVSGQPMRFGTFELTARGTTLTEPTPTP